MHSLLAKIGTIAAGAELTPLNIVIFAVVAVLFLTRPAPLRGLRNGIRSVCALVERHPVATMALVALVPLGARLALLPSHPIPNPRIHDEFSYLLAADTFAHGRVTNPPHPLWEFFETMHVLPIPTYMSKYPPAQGLFLAAGQVLFGQPWWGVFLSIGVMVGAVCWMLQGWLPGRWAVLGALAVALQFGIGHAWMNSYWGGAPAAIGACLMLGAFARLRRFRSFPPHPVRYSVIFALGLLLALNSRPWEGLAVAIPAGIAAFLWASKEGKWAISVRTLLIPAAGILALGGIAMLYYNWRITGSALQMPYTAVHKFYSVTPLFVWQKRTPDPQYHHAEMKRFYLQSEPHYQDADTLNTLRGWLAIEPGRLRMTKDLLFGNFFLALCLALVFFRPSPSHKFLLVTMAIFLVALALECWNQIHYFGPVIGLAAILKMTSLRRLSTLKLGHPLSGRRLGSALAAGVIVCSGVTLARDAVVFPQPDSFSQDRARIEQELESSPGSHVVLVRYTDSHPTSQEWVYNGADIDGSKVIWAREMSDQDNQRLFEYFKGRKFWLVEPDVTPVQARPISLAKPAELKSASAGQVGASLDLRPQWR